VAPRPALRVAKPSPRTKVKKKKRKKEKKERVLALGGGVKLTLGAIPKGVAELPLQFFIFYFFFKKSLLSYGLTWRICVI
jgi:hypothetical protein